MKTFAIALFFLSLNSQATASLNTKSISYFELSDANPEFVLKQNPDNRIAHKYHKLSVDQATHIKDKKNIWVWVESSCETQTVKFEEDSTCAPKMLHYSEYLRALNSKAL